MGLLLHCGCEEVSRSDLKMIRATPKSDTHAVISHFDMLESIEKSVERTGAVTIVPDTSIHGVSHDGERCFGFMDIVTRATELTDGTIMNGDVQLQIVWRNANDFAFTADARGGTRTFCCDNLSIAGNMMEFGNLCGRDKTERKGRKHTKNIYSEMPQLLDDSMYRLMDQVDKFEERYMTYMNTKVNDRQMHHLVCQALDVNNGGKNKSITTQFVQPVLEEWYDSQFSEFRGKKNAWSAFSSFTTAGTKGTKNRPIPLNEQAVRTENLHKIFDEHCNVVLN